MTDQNSRQFTIVVPRPGQSSLVYPEVAGELAVKHMRRLVLRGFSPVAQTTANGITEELTLSEMKEIYPPTSVVDYGETLNLAQKVCLQSYDDGAFSHLKDCKTEDEFELAIQDCGDSLLRFLVSELSSDEDCDSLEVARQRVRTAVTQLFEVFQALEEAESEQPLVAIPRG